MLRMLALNSSRRSNKALELPAEGPRVSGGAGGVLDGLGGVEISLLGLVGQRPTVCRRSRVVARLA